MVWLYVEQDRPSALEGSVIVAAKVAHQTARASRAPAASSPLRAASYGLRLTLEEMKLAARLAPGARQQPDRLSHAVFYSIRGRRVCVSEPDLFLHNNWRSCIGLINRYDQRLVLGGSCEGVQVCQVAILGDGSAIPWREGRFSSTSARIDSLQPAPDAP